MAEPREDHDKLVEEIAKKLPLPAIPRKNYLVRCRVENVVEGGEDDFMDIISGENEEDAKDYLSGILGDHDLVVIDWLFIRDVESLRDLARVLSR